MCESTLDLLYEAVFILWLYSNVIQLSFLYTLLNIHYFYTIYTIHYTVSIQRLYTNQVSIENYKQYLASAFWTMGGSCW